MADVVIEEKEQFEALPEAVRSAFVEDNGKFVLKQEDVTGLKTTLEKEREARKQYERELKKFKDVDPEKYAALVAAEQERGDKELIDAGKVEELVNERIKRAQTEWSKEKTQLSEQLTGANALLDQLLIDNEVVKVVESSDSKVRVRAGAIEDVLMHAKQCLKRVNGDVVVTKPGSAEPEYGKDGKKMGIREWLGELATRKPYLFEGSSGAGTTNSGGGTPPKKPFPEWSQEEKDAYIGEHGWQAYEQLLLRQQKK